jgi:hypothetical protein
MTSRLLTIEHALLGLTLSLCMVCAGAQEREAIFRAVPRQASPASAVATVVEPADGQFVYSSELPATRPFIRFAIGKTPPADYSVFSAEEQHELEALRSRSVEEQKPTEPPLTHAHARSGGQARANVTRRAVRSSTCEPTSNAGHVAGLAWPKVVQEGERVCVPKLEFAEQPDWRDHLWCFNKGDGSVR